MTSRTAPTAADLNTADDVRTTITVGDVVHYCGSIEACHGPAEVVAIAAHFDVGAEFCAWARLTLRTSNGTLEDVRPRSITRRHPTRH